MQLNQEEIKNIYTIIDNHIRMIEESIKNYVEDTTIIELIKTTDKFIYKILDSIIMNGRILKNTYIVNPNKNKWIEIFKNNYKTELDKIKDYYNTLFISCDKILKNSESLYLSQSYSFLFHNIYMRVVLLSNESKILKVI